MSPADAQAGIGTDVPAGVGPDAAAGSRVRPRRADAQRNRDLLLAAAKDVFTERGIDAPLDDVARRAGVGNATMYRHFPTRSDLIVAVYADEVADLCARGEGLAATHEPREALFSWLADFIAHVASKKELALAIADDRAGTRSTLFGQWHAAMHATATTLLTRARRVAAVRADLDVADLLSLANGIALSGASPDRLERLLTLVREGVETGPSR
ncbi:MAG TPA: helix-turn-helix domain-containing protein [Pseudonocardiaceae bacterium]